MSSSVNRWMSGRSFSIRLRVNGIVIIRRIRAWSAPSALKIVSSRWSTPSAIALVGNGNPGCFSSTLTRGSDRIARCAV